MQNNLCIVDGGQGGSTSSVAVYAKLYARNCTLNEYFAARENILHLDCEFYILLPKFLDATWQSNMISLRYFIALSRSESTQFRYLRN